MELGEGHEISGKLQSPVRNIPVPDIIHDHFMGFVKHLVNNPVISNPDPVQRFRTASF